MLPTPDLIWYHLPGCHLQDCVEESPRVSAPASCCCFICAINQRQEHARSVLAVNTALIALPFFPVSRLFLMTEGGLTVLQASINDREVLVRTENC